MSQTESGRNTLSDNLAGALLMMASLACFTFNDTLVKATGGALPLWQLLFLRGVISVVLLFALGLSLRAVHFRIARRDWGYIGIRSAAEIGAAYFFLTALLQMPIANVMAILQILPLTVALAAALFLGESLGWRRLIAIAVGFAGMLLIVRPGSEGFTQMSVYALISVLMITLRDIATRKMSAEVPALSVSIAAAVSVTLFSGLASIPQGWEVVTPRLWALIFGAAFFILGAYFFSVQVMRKGDIGFVAPFRYTGLLWAIVLGWLVFGEFPDAFTLLGAAIIVATGIYTIYREQRASRA